MPKAVVSKTAETNAVSTYYVSKLAGPRIGKRRVAKGDALEMSEYQARALLASGALVKTKDAVDDPFGEAAAKAAADAEAAEAADAAAKDKAAAEAEAKAAIAKAAADEADAEAKARAAQAANHAAGDLAADEPAQHHDGA